MHNLLLGLFKLILEPLNVILILALKEHYFILKLIYSLVFLFQLVLMLILISSDLLIHLVLLSLQLFLEPVLDISRAYILLLL